MKWLWNVVLGAILICACGCGLTPYHKAGVASKRGYSDTRLSEDTFHVKFVADFTTPDEILHEYLYRRAVEVTLHHGFRYFAVVREARPITMYRTRYRCRADETAGLDGFEVEVPKLGTLHMTIQCFKDRPDAGAVRLVDAQAFVHGPPIAMGE